MPQKKIENEENNKLLKAYLGNIPYAYYDQEINILCQRLKVTRQVLHNYLSGYTRIPELAKQVIDQYTMEYNNSKIDWK